MHLLAPLKMVLIAQLAQRLIIIIIIIIIIVYYYEVHELLYYAPCKRKVPLDLSILYPERTDVPGISFS
jgi:hypothetical protein